MWQVKKRKHKQQRLSESDEEEDENKVNEEQSGSGSEEDSEDEEDESDEGEWYGEIRRKHALKKIGAGEEVEFVKGGLCRKKKKEECVKGE